MATIEIEPATESGSMTWRGVTVKQDGKEYPVSVCVMRDTNIGFTSYEVTWVEETPENALELEAKIKAEMELMED